MISKIVFTISIILLPQIVLAQSAVTCGDESATDTYQNVPCARQSESNFWVQSDGQPPSATAMPPSTSNAPTVAAESASSANQSGDRNPDGGLSPGPIDAGASPTSDSSTPGELLIGMTASQVRQLLGEPTEITQEECVDGRLESWSYGSSRVVQFDSSGHVSSN